MRRWMSLLALVLSFLLPGVAWAGVNVNTASSAELQTLPGIGPSKAEAIVAYRNENGPFSSLSALDAVPGIGPSTLQNISPLVDFGEASGSAPIVPAQGKDLSPPNAPAAAAPAPSAPKAGGSGVNINVASAAELESLPGIGAAKAAAIVESRQNQGPFTSCQDLTRVNGIGQATVANMGSGCRAE